MGPRHLPAARSLIAALAAAVVVATPAPAQGPVYRERWGYLHLEHLRGELWRALRAAEPAVVARTADWLIEPDGNPFRPVARAIAALRDVPGDAAWVLRSMVCTYVLPEVADPDGSNENCRRTNVSLFLPFATELPGDVTFDFEARDAAGEHVWAVQLADAVTLEDLRSARHCARIPAADLADGSYRLVVRTRVAGAEPGPADPVREWPFHVLRGYQERCEAAFRLVGERAEGLADGPRAVLLGSAAAVQRAYHGEAFDVTSDAVRDLERLEHVLANVVAERHPATGLGGLVPLVLPTVAPPRGLFATVRLPADFAPATARERPLVVFVGAAPAYDPTLVRPLAPSSRDPRWLADEMATFGRDLGCDVACLESPGEVENYAAALAAALPALRSLFGTGAAPLLLVAEGEAATIAAFHLARLQDHLQGLVLVGGGAMAGPTLDALAVPVRLQPLVGASGSDGLQRSLDYVRLRREAGADVADVARLSERALPWFGALPLLQAELEVFAARVFQPPDAPK